MTEKDELLQAKDRELAEAQQQLKQQVSCVHVQYTFLYTCACMSIHVCVYYTGRNYQGRGAVSAGQGEGASSGAAATETAGNLHHLVYYETGADCEH